MDIEEYRQRARQLLAQHWDILIVLAAACLLFMYNLQGWRVMTLEELPFYRNFVNNWFASKRIHSFFTPTYVLAYPVPTRDFITLRYFTAALSVAGALLFHQAVKIAAESRYAALAATALLLTDSWILWYGRHFAWFWSGLTLSALSMYLLFRFREKALIPNSIVNAVGIINLSQAVFFAIPFLFSQFTTLRKEIELRYVVLAVLVFAVLVIPPADIFMEKQSGHLEESTQYQSADQGRTSSIILNVTGLAEQLSPFNILGGFYYTIDPFNTFSEFKKRLMIPSEGTLYFYDNLHPTRYNLLAAALLLFPIYLFINTDWKYRDFFTVGTLSAFLFIPVFPFVADETYFWSLSLFIYPTLGYGLVKGKSYPIKILAAILIGSLLFLQGTESYNRVITYDYEELYQDKIQVKIEDRNITVSQRAEYMILHWNSSLLEDQNYTVKKCSAIEDKSRPVLTSDACSMPEMTKQDTPKWLNLFEPVESN